MHFILRSPCETESSERVVTPRDAHLPFPIFTAENISTADVARSESGGLFMLQVPAKQVGAASGAI